MDAYKIGVCIVLANGVSPVLAIIGKDLLGLKTSVGEIEKSFGRWGTAIGAVGLALGGAAILGAVTKLAEKAADFQDAMTKVSQLNPKVAALVQSGEIKRMSFDVATRLGMKVEDVTKVYGGIYGAIQDPKESEELLPYAARYARLMQMRHPGSHPEDSIRTLLRAGEDSGRLTDDAGKIDPKKVEQWLDMAARLEAATHGQVNADVLFQLAQHGGGVSLRGLSQEGYEHMAIVAQMLGGARAGTSLLSLRQQMTGTMFSRNAEAFEKYGLLKPGEWRSDHGHVVMEDSGKDRLLGLVNKDPMKFVNTLVDRFEAMGITDKDKQMQAITELLGRQTTQRMISDMFLARSQIQRETEGLEQGATVRQGLQGYDGNIHAAQQNMGAAWHNLQVAIGGPEGERFASFLNKIAGAINSVTDRISKLSPETIDNVFKVVAGFATGLIALGGILTVALISSIVGLPAIIGAAVIALGSLAALNWDNITGWLKSDSIAQAFAGLGDAILDAIKNQLKRIIPGLGGGGPVSPESKKFNEDIDKANKNYVPMKFTPGTNTPKMQQASFSLNVDGRSLAQSVVDHLESIYGMPTGAAAADGANSYFGGDHQYSSI